MRMLMVIAFTAASFAASPAAGAADRWYPSKYGADDRLGALNLLSPELVREAAKLITTGKTYALGVETGRHTPAVGTRTFQIFTMAANDGSGATQGTNEGIFNDDLLMTWLGIGSQIDGLGHFGIGHRYYNGVHVSEFLQPDGVTTFGIHTLPPIVTRGVLLDVAAFKSVKRLDGGTPINKTELEGAARRQGVELRRGDVVILNTGWQAVATEDPETFLASEPGLGVEGAEYLVGKGVVAVGADNWALEVFPSENEQEWGIVHQMLLARNGVYILENMRTDELVADGVSEFLFTLGAARFVGAVQMVINPVGIR